MYDPLSEVYMVQKMDENRNRMHRPNPELAAARAGRRWWRKASHRTG